MNPWDLVTWLASIILAASAVVIFAMFLRDAKSTLNRETQDKDESKDPRSSAATPDRASPTPPENLPR